MTTLTTKNLRVPAAKAITAIIAVTAAVLLPQLFHAVGVLSGTGAAVGSALLPMQLPVLICGFVAGPFAGMAAGILSPIVSFMISGMPSAVILPFMAIELAVYGLMSGILGKTKLSTFASLIITQIAGRIVRSGAVIIAVTAMGNSALTMTAAYIFILEGIFGIMIQWLAVPASVKALESVKKYYV